MTQVPHTLAATLQGEALAALEAALAPPPPLRPNSRFELEVEVAGEGTFVVVMEGGTVSAKKGFARSPMISAQIPKGGFQLIQKELQAAVDGFPAAPELRRIVNAWQSPKPGELDELLRAIEKLKDAAVRFDVKGIGSYALARGSVDEATRVLTVKLDPMQVEGLLTGAPLTSLRVDVGGDRSVLTAVVAALGPALQRMRLA